MGKKGWVKLIVVVVVVALLMIVIFQNREPQSLRVLFWPLSFSPSLVLIVTFLLGFLVGRLSIPYIGRRKGQ